MQDRIDWLREFFYDYRLPLATGFLAVIVTAVSVLGFVSLRARAGANDLAAFADPTEAPDGQPLPQTRPAGGRREAATQAIAETVDPEDAQDCGVSRADLIYCEDDEGYSYRADATQRYWTLMDVPADEQSRRWSQTTGEDLDAGEDVPLDDPPPSDLPPPSEEPTDDPTDPPPPSEEPTDDPTDDPTEPPPSEEPTEEPTDDPTEPPPSEEPTEEPPPSEEPTEEPTDDPTEPPPSEEPTEEPTDDPTEPPPSEEPTEEPTEELTDPPPPSEAPGLVAIGL